MELKLITHYNTKSIIMEWFYEIPKIILYNITVRLKYNPLWKGIYKK